MIVIRRLKQTPASMPNPCLVQLVLLIRLV